MPSAGESNFRMSVREIREWSEPGRHLGKPTRIILLVPSTYPVVAPVQVRSVRWSREVDSDLDGIPSPRIDIVSASGLCLFDAVCSKKFVVASPHYRPSSCIPQIRGPRGMPGRADTSPPRVMSSPSSPSRSYGLISRSGSFGGP